MRKLKELKCKMCGLETKSNGLAGHIKSKHSLTTEQYVERYGEFRLKQLDYKSRSDKQYECKICCTQCASERHLSHHIRVSHKMDKVEYVKRYIFNDVPQLCKCGCGEEVRVVGHPPYISQYITGHNAFMHIGMKRDNKSRMRMRKAAIERIKKGRGVFFYNGVSKEELDLRDFIEEKYSGKIVSNDKTLLNGLELDVYLPELRTAIELNGDRFHSDLYKPKRYHLNKTEECNNLGINLIHIWLTDWYKKRDIVKSILLHKLGKTPNKIFARKTKVGVLSNKVYQRFLEENHLQGPSISKLRLGLWNDDKLVQVMGFSSIRKILRNINGQNEWELIRMCSLKDFHIVGGADKLLKYFIKVYQPKKIISYANRDWSDGGIYEKLGFTFKQFTPPGYFYVKSKTRYNRIQFQKHKLVKSGASADKTEYEIMTENGFYRIWNTGNYVYEMNLK